MSSLVRNSTVGTTTVTSVTGLTWDGARQVGKTLMANLSCANSAQILRQEDVYRVTSYFRPTDEPLYVVEIVLQGCWTIEFDMASAESPYTVKLAGVMFYISSIDYMTASFNEPINKGEPTMNVEVAVKAEGEYFAKGDVVEVVLKPIDRCSEWAKECASVGIDNTSGSFLAAVRSCEGISHVTLDLSEALQSKILRCSYSKIESIVRIQEVNDADCY